MSEPRYPTVHVEVPVRAVDDACARLFSLGASGVEVRDATTLQKPSRAAGALLVAHFADDDRARIAASVLPWTARLEHIVGDAWRHRWKEFFKPMRIGARLLVRPSWEAVAPRRGDVVLTLDPGQAFGTGAHESTRLALAEIEARIRGGERVLDAGCGSGILAIAALLLGAARATAVDIERDAIVATRRNAAMNAVADRIETRTISVAKVRGSFDLVLANIESRVLRPLARTLVATLAPGGLLVLSGLLASEEDEMRRAYRALEHVATRAEKDWIAITLRAPTRTPPRKKAAPSAKGRPNAEAGAPSAARSRGSATRHGAAKGASAPPRGARARPSRT